MRDENLKSTGDAFEKEPEEQFEVLSDEQIAGMAMEDPEALEYLLDKYKNFVRIKSRSYFLLGADHEDIVQEGMIGLYKAIRDFKPDKQSSFKAFAELCITRQIITAIKTASRQKHKPLNFYVSLNKPVYEENADQSLMDILPGASAATNPEELFIGRENVESIEEQVKKLLSSYEKQVFSLYLEGKSYQEIAKALHKHVKSVDNALQRIKKKLAKYLEI